MNIGIVGGGITGLSLGYELSKKGHHVTVFEKSARVGGLVGSFRIGSVWLEKYFHHIFLSDVSLRALISELDLDKDMFWETTSMGFYGSGRIFPFDGPKDLLTFSHLSFSDRLKFAWNIFQAGRDAEGLKLDSMTAKEWIERRWSSEIYSKFWGPLLQSKFSESADSISAAWLWGRIYARANSRTSKSGGKEKLGYLRGGFVRILEALSKKIEERKGTVRLQEEVLSVTRTSSSNWSIRTSRGEDPFDAVVLTVPSPIITHLCPDLPLTERTLHQNVRYVSILCMPILMNRSLSPIYWLNVGDRSLPFTGVIEHTNYVPREDYEGSHVVYLFNYLPQNHPWLKEDKETVFARYEEGLRKIFFTYDRSQVIQTMIFRDPYANVIYEKDYRSKQPPIVSELPGLYFANTSHIFPEDRNQNYSVELAKKVASTFLKV